MINLKCVKTYCCDDISLIENYNEAINDMTQKWHCHHRLETDMNLSYKELKEKNLYYNRPASELIFLTPSEHNKLHHTGKIGSEETKQKQSESLKGEKNPMYGRSPSKETRKKQSDINTGARFMVNGIERHYVLKEEIDYYLEKGYIFGYKL